MRKFSPDLLFLTLSALTLSIPAIAAQPQIISLTPSSGGGLTATFALTVSDTDGASDIPGMNLLVNSSFNSQDGCWLYYDHASRQATMYVQNQNNWIPVTSAAWTTGSRCSAELAYATDSGNDATVAFNINFNSSWAGAKTIWARAGSSLTDTGYENQGSWNVGAGLAPDFIVLMDPLSQSIAAGTPAIYSIQFTSINNFTGVVNMAALASALPPGLSVVTKVNGVPQSNVAVSPSAPSFATIEVDSATNTPATDLIAVTGDFQYGSLRHFTQAALHLVSPISPSVTMDLPAGSGLDRTVTIHATDPAGAAAVTGISILLNSTLDGSHACWLYYAPRALSLASDDGSSWSTSSVTSGLPPAQPVRNSQCSAPGPIAIASSGNTLNLTVPLTFSAGFTGTRQIWVRAADAAGVDSGYIHLGAVTLDSSTAQPDFGLDVSPGTVTATSPGNATWTVQVNGYNGYATPVSISVTGLPPAMNLENAPATVPPNGFGIYIASVTSATPPGSYPVTITGTDGVHTHTATITIVVPDLLGTVPSLVAIADGPPGTTRIWSFATLQHFTGNPAPSSMHVLIADAVDGRNACWLYYDLSHRLMLASDDIASWAAPDATNTVSNGHCSVTYQDASNDGALGFNATITMLNGFAPGNIYMEGRTPQGADTGYQLAGSWNAPYPH